MVVLLAPMAGITTDTAFRRLCREEMATQLDPGATGGLFVSEMITTRALVQRNAKTMRLIRFEADETPRSMQLYGVAIRRSSARTVRMIVDEDLADHVDLNFGCPVPKVTRKGGGSAPMPWQYPVLRGHRAQAAVTGADGAVPDHRQDARRHRRRAPHIPRGRAASRRTPAPPQVALHGRTANQFYGGTADWEPIADLVQLLDIPVLGNGDIWEAEDALRMVRETGCAGVVVGRGCLGRPWLFADLAAAFAGRPDRARPNLGAVARTMRRHAELLAEWEGERWGVTDFRKHIAWYLKGFAVGSEVRSALANSSSLAELDDLLARLDPDPAVPRRGRARPAARTHVGGAPGYPARTAGWKVATPASCPLVPNSPTAAADDPGTNHCAEQTSRVDAPRGSAGNLGRWSAMSTKFVYDFTEGNRNLKDLLGGKGANLAEMTNLGLPVPPGFTITTEACQAYLRAVR